MRTISLPSLRGQRNQWVNDPDYADEMYQFAIADLDHDGRLELIVSNCGGTGIYTYSRFYRVEENGTLKELKTSFCRGGFPTGFDCG